MTAKSFRKFQTYLYDEKGKPIMVQLDLRNKAMKEFIEDAMADFEDTLIAMERDNDDTISHEEVRNRVLSLQAKK